jgi:hypothetical protein
MPAVCTMGSSVRASRGATEAVFSDGSVERLTGTVGKFNRTVNRNITLLKFADRQEVVCRGGYIRYWRDGVTKLAALSSSLRFGI